MVAAAQNIAPQTAAAPAKLEVKDLSISYGSQTILSDVNLSIQENEIFGIIGPANAGKTSFIKTIRPRGVSISCPNSR